MVLDCLIVKKEWLDLILSGVKTIEVRGTRTKKRGTIGLIESGSGEIKGVTDLIASIRIGKGFYETNVDKHRIQSMSFGELPYKEPYAWCLERSRRLKTPIPYKHPQGAVIWVKVDVPDDIISNAM